MKCPKCEGRGEINNLKAPYNWHSHLDKEMCPKCNGKGKILIRYNCSQCKEVFSIQSTNWEEDVQYCPFCGGIRPLTDFEKAKSERVNCKILEAIKSEKVEGGEKE